MGRLHVGSRFPQYARWQYCKLSLFLSGGTYATISRNWELISDGKGKMEAAVFILSLVDCCVLIFLSVYFVSFHCVYFWWMLSVLAKAVGLVKCSTVLLILTNLC